MPLTLYNTLTRRKQVFVPMDPPQVRLYTCGPTVYNYAHIGNLRTYIFEDVLRRTLELAGYDVLHVMNITDVGHMTTDEDAGDDKMDVAARRENKSPHEIARFYEDAFFRDTDRLNILRPHIAPRATEHIADMIALIQRLESNGYTYVTSQAVYFDTSRDPEYGALGRLNLAEQRHGARAEVVTDETKRSPTDFALWFLNKPTHIMQWESPWGTGYPGWHIECSAMSMRYLGPTFDIHCGGVDHIPVHHTNEIAQSEAATHQPFVRYWLHGEFLQMNKQKVSKSTGGSINTLQSLIDEGYDPIAFRYLCLQAHYRSDLNFSTDSLDAATAGLRKVYAACPDDDVLARDDGAFTEARTRVTEAIHDDLGLPQAVGLLNTYDSHRLWREFDSVLGLDVVARSCPDEDEIPADIADLVHARNDARLARDWSRSDAIRTRLNELGYDVGDGPGGTTVKHRAV